MMRKTMLTPKLPPIKEESFEQTSKDIKSNPEASNEVNNKERAGLKTPPKKSTVSAAQMKREALL